MSEDTLFADGFEAAFLGIGVQFNRELAIYDRQKCVEILMERDGMDEDEAEKVVRDLWGACSIPEMVDALQARAPGIKVTPFLIWATKRRLDTIERNGAE